MPASSVPSWFLPLGSCFGRSDREVPDEINPPKFCLVKLLLVRALYYSNRKESRAQGDGLEMSSCSKCNQMKTSSVFIREGASEGRIGEGWRG